MDGADSGSPIDSGHGGVSPGGTGGPVSGLAAVQGHDPSAWRGWAEPTAEEQAAMAEEWAAALAKGTTPELEA